MVLIAYSPVKKTEGVKSITSFFQFSIFFLDFTKNCILHHRCKMLRKPTIRILGSILLLLTFTFSITPKIWLHSLVAHHKDIHSSLGGQTDQLTKAGYHCDCESQVVVLPYLDLPAYNPQEPAAFFPPFQNREGDQIYPAGHFIFGLRGPPANASLI
jgi:hypothetical protein